MFGMSVITGGAGMERGKPPNSGTTACAQTLSQKPINPAIENATSALLPYPEKNNVMEEIIECNRF
jgi:hypothetical protein